MRFNTQEFSIEFDERDQQIGGLPSSVPVNETEIVFDDIYSLYVATLHHRNDLDDHLGGQEISTKQIIKLGTLDYEVSRLYDLTMKLGLIVGPKIVDELIDSVPGASKVTP